MMPLQFAGTSIEHDQGIGVKISAGTSLGQKIRGRICHRNVDMSGLMIERKRCPDRAPATLSYIRFAPGFSPGFVVIRNCVESPDRFACFELECADPALYPLLADSKSEQNQILENHRRHIERAVALFRGDNLSLPQKLVR